MPSECLKFVEYSIEYPCHGFFVPCMKSLSCKKMNNNRCEITLPVVSNAPTFRYQIVTMYNGQKVNMTDSSIIDLPKKFKPDPPQICNTLIDFREKVVKFQCIESQDCFDKRDYMYNFYLINNDRTQVLQLDSKISVIQRPFNQFHFNQVYSWFANTKAPSQLVSDNTTKWSFSIPSNERSEIKPDATATKTRSSATTDENTNFPCRPIICPWLYPDISPVPIESAGKPIIASYTPSLGGYTTPRKSQVSTLIPYKLLKTIRPTINDLGSKAWTMSNTAETRQATYSKNNENTDTSTSKTTTTRSTISTGTSAPSAIGCYIIIVVLLGILFVLSILACYVQQSTKNVISKCNGENSYEVKTNIADRSANHVIVCYPCKNSGDIDKNQVDIPMDRITNLPNSNVDKNKSVAPFRVADQLQNGYSLRNPCLNRNNANEDQNNEQVDPTASLSDNIIQVNYESAILSRVDNQLQHRQKGGKVAINIEENLQNRPINNRESSASLDFTNKNDDQQAQFAAFRQENVSSNLSIGYTDLIQQMLINNYAPTVEQVNHTVRNFHNDSKTERIFNDGSSFRRYQFRTSGGIVVPNRLPPLIHVGINGLMRCYSNIETGVNDAKENSYYDLPFAKNQFQDFDTTENFNRLSGISNMNNNRLMRSYSNFETGTKDDKRLTEGYRVTDVNAIDINEQDINSSLASFPSNVTLTFYPFTSRITYSNSEVAIYSAGNSNAADIGSLTRLPAYENFPFSNRYHRDLSMDSARRTDSSNSLFQYFDENYAKYSYTWRNCDDISGFSLLDKWSDQSSDDSNYDSQSILSLTNVHPIENRVE
ncbi:hypothetical protein TrispH2_002988 [Trichoplax sp. H2]|nr:hypothetical protein TrispH2_002988 [Trichoplax sp. H2]|eukprot:RDD45085.1 hypothetical protein TrispH2_002988 [Trichoplax sp. H2]